jgi:X-X-X-Leu-X-X-Gly heptad repeat protein
VRAKISGASVVVALTKGVVALTNGVAAVTNGVAAVTNGVAVNAAVLIRAVLCTQ